ncbi:cytochrome P450 monooxygenase, putative [Trichophyton verrucosum HKI 0517]|uniref:Cytochrome P450 monooxygenase, putative n=1 Tax=Trichophyton verrucosum (strain HKI 0517) TaxID=663202 RepID=D4DHZ5_TRIVH|nr:cytochrome P450 monooxygenase, putative [Trichophyton verrucosum HKI 0517]EFE38551.1 cytochrome P450 monooxygenase, putative [Trichophyton verrucosum HKI 0517]
MVVCCVLCVVCCVWAVDTDNYTSAGPREISVNNVAAVRDIHGYGSVCLKGPFYDLNYPSRSLQMTRDKAFHSRRRRTWDRGFSPKALSEYEPRVYQHCLDLVKQLSRLAGTPVDIGKWFKYFGFDVMGDLSFGRPFDMLTTGNPHFLFGMMESSKPVVGTLIGVPWLFILFQKLPGISRVRSNWISWCGVQVQERMKLGTTRPDLFSYILGNDLSEATSDGDLTYDAELAIVAGSETTALNLTTVLYLLALHPEQKKALQAEVDLLIPTLDQFSHQKLASSHLLEGCINEGLRLYPPVPSGVQRLTPPQGAMIADRWIPGDTIVSTPTYTLHRGTYHHLPSLLACSFFFFSHLLFVFQHIVSFSIFTSDHDLLIFAFSYFLGRFPVLSSLSLFSQILDSRYFVQPNHFIPERWSSKPELIIRKDAFNPFLAGRYSCAGRPLAMMEMRMLLAMVVRLFDFSFPKESRAGSEKLYDGKGGFRDYFTAGAPTVPLVFTKRSLDTVANGT